MPFTSYVAPGSSHTGLPLLTVPNGPYLTVPFSVPRTPGRTVAPLATRVPPM